MSIKINYKNSASKNPSNNLILFVDEKFNLNSLKRYLSNSEFSLATSKSAREYLSEVSVENDLLVLMKL